MLAPFEGNRSSRYNGGGMCELDAIAADESAPLPCYVTDDLALEQQTSIRWDSKSYNFFYFFFQPYSISGLNLSDLARDPSSR